VLDHLKKHDVDLEDPGDEIGPEFHLGDLSGATKSIVMQRDAD
jgi:hypothetical protein